MLNYCENSQSQVKDFNASGRGVHEAIISLGDSVPGFTDDVDTPIFKLKCEFILEKKLKWRKRCINLFVYMKGRKI